MPIDTTDASTFNIRKKVQYMPLISIYVNRYNIGMSQGTQHVPLKIFFPGELNKLRQNARISI